MFYNYDLYKGFEGENCIEFFFKNGSFKVWELKWYYCVAEPIYNMIPQREQLPIEYLDYTNGTGWEEITSEREYPCTVINVEASLVVLKKVITLNESERCQSTIEQLIEFLSIALSQQEEVSIRYFDY